MATKKKKKPTKADLQKQLARIGTLGIRWANAVAHLNVMASPTYHLYKALRKYEASLSESEGRS